MSESIQLRDPLFRLVIRFSNGEKVQYIVTEPVDSHKLGVDARSYAVVTAVQVDKPNEVADVLVASLRDVSYIKTERVTLEQLAADRRMAGMRSAGALTGEDKPVKILAKVIFI